MRIVLIDNYDSFTHNLADQVTRFNAQHPLIFENDQITLDELNFTKPDAVILSPGPGRPENQDDIGIGLQIVQQLSVPILGVCLGHQTIAHSFGGRIIQAAEPMHGRLSRIHHSDNTIFNHIPSEFDVVRYHSLLVDSALPDDLMSLAYTEDGDLMAIRHKTKPIWGVQFHPESISTDFGDRIIENFLRLVSLTRNERTAPVPKKSYIRKKNSDVVSYRLIHQKIPFKASHDILSLFEHLSADTSNRFIFGSHNSDSPACRFVYMGISRGTLSHKISYSLSDNQVLRTSNDQTDKLNQDIFSFLKAALSIHGIVETDLPFDFVGGYLGYFGYELKALCGGKEAHLSDLPDAQFIFWDRFLVYDRLKSELYVVALWETEEQNVESSHWINKILKAVQQFPAIKKRLVNKSVQSIKANEFTLESNRDQYLQDIAFCQDQITQGESYEVCLTNRLRGPALSSPFASYRALCNANPAPYASYFEFEGLAILCSSPECFLTINRLGTVTSRPIKGTIKRKNQGNDNEQVLTLKNSDKDRAENLMIVDLVRNDLHRVCQPGSVHVPQLMAIESYATVHQMVSTVQGKLRVDQDIIDCVKSAFPGGSMTGAPKIRTMEIIDQLEKSPRGIYSGAIGYLSFNGAADLGMVIRTIISRRNGIEIGTGGAIVSLSHPDQEFQEILLKMQALLASIKSSEQDTDTLPVS